MSLPSTLTAGMLSEVDLTHSSGTQQSENAVPGEGLPDRQRHGRILATSIGTRQRSKHQRPAFVGRSGVRFLTPCAAK
jgi:hypothetical protein